LVVTSLLEEGGQKTAIEAVPPVRKMTEKLSMGGVHGK